MTRLPSIYISHGMPLMAIEPSLTGRFLADLPRHFDPPQTIVCISAHMESVHPLVTADAWPETIHDFGGFPPDLYAMRYPAPGAPELAGEIVTMLKDSGFQAKPLIDRGLDHGTWVPLSLMYPKASIPVIQLSVQTEESPAYHLALGQALTPLRDENILILASGGATHDLSAMPGHRRTDPPAAYAEAFDRWLETIITTGKTDMLLNYRQSAPAAERNHPYPAEHFLPLLVAAGAGGPSIPGTRLHRHFEYSVLSLAAYRWD